MAYEIEFEDKGQDLLRLTVDEDTALITDSGLLSWEFATGRYEVIVGDLLVDRVGGAKHGHLATGFVTIDLHTIEADWSSMPHQTEVQAARQEVSKMTVQDEHGCWVA